VKTVSARDLQKKVKECVDRAQEDRVVITRHGRPAAVMIGVEGRDWEDVALGASPAFWRLIRSRRKEPTIPMDEMKKRLASRRKAATRSGKPRQWP
jgi:prevent-host-death family protein